MLSYPCCSISLVTFSFVAPATVGISSTMFAVVSSTTSSKVSRWNAWLANNTFHSPPWPRTSCGSAHPSINCKRLRQAQVLGKTCVVIHACLSPLLPSSCIHMVVWTRPLGADVWMVVLASHHLSSASARSLRGCSVGIFSWFLFSRWLFSTRNTAHSLPLTYRTQSKITRMLLKQCSNDKHRLGMLLCHQSPINHFVDLTFNKKFIICFEI